MCSPEVPVKSPMATHSFLIVQVCFVLVWLSRHGLDGPRQTHTQQPKEAPWRYTVSNQNIQIPCQDCPAYAGEPLQDQIISIRG